MNPLVKYVIDQVWSIPDGSSQLIITPGRISPTGGYSRIGAVGWYNVPVPVIGKRYHYYQIGGAWPTDFNLEESEDEWKNIQDVSNSTALEFTVYNEKGLVVPRYCCHYRRIPDGNLILAVEILDKLDHQWDKDALHFRIFKNPFFNRAGLPEGAQQYLTKGKLIERQQDILMLQNEISAIRATTSVKDKVTCYVNGKMVDTINIVSAKAGDYAEFVYDSSIYLCVTSDYLGLPHFQSVVDQTRKYALLVGTGWSGDIDHHYNVDVHIGLSDRSDFRFVNKNRRNSMRMITFKDYSFNADYLDDYLSELADPRTGVVDASKIKVRLIIRQDGNPQKVQSSANRIEFLLKLSPAQQRSAILDHNSPWYAPLMEQDPYLRIMSASFNSITPDSASEAVGYSQTSKILAPALQTTSVVEDNASIRTLTPTEQLRATNCTAYWYDDVGKLLTVQEIAATASDLTVPQNYRFVEIVGGTRETSSTGVTKGNTATLIPGFVSHIYYVRQDGSSFEIPDYSEVTYTATTISYPEGEPLVDPKTGVGFVPDTSRFRIVSEGVHVFDEGNILPSDGVILITPTVRELRNVGTSQNPQIQAVQSPIEIPYGDYDIWLNDRCLVEGIDYRRVGNQFVVFVKEYLGDRTAPQRYAIRCTGKPTMVDGNTTWGKTSEHGFVYDGRISLDGQYDVYEHQNCRLTVGGYILPFSKTYLNENRDTSILPNGKPYEVREPLRTLGPHYHKSENARNRQRLIDKSVSDYLSARLPETFAEFSTFPQKHRLFSPLMGKLITAMSSGSLVGVIPVGDYDDMRVRAVLSPYMWLYDYDPINPSNRPNLNYCEVHPHWGESSLIVTADQYKFLTAVNRVLGGNIVDLRTLVTIA
jgi:hypothetical protein